MFKNPKPDPTKREAEAAARLLKLELDGLTPEAVKTAFRKAAIAAHPDARSGAEVEEVAREMIGLAQEARDTLIRWLASLPDARCPYCKGTGYRRIGAFGAKPCPYC